MRDLSSYFKNRTIDYLKLTEFGFVKKESVYFYERAICHERFKIRIEITEKKQISRIIDQSLDEEYFLVDIQNASGDFVGQIREEYENFLNHLVDQCSIFDSFKSSQAKEVIDYIQNQYGDGLEYLWEKSPNNAIWRNKVNRKWYGILMVIPERKLGIDSERVIEVLDLRYQKEPVAKIIDHKKIFEGYHMNKKNWITIRLDRSVKTEEIKQMINHSVQCSLKK